MILVKLGKANGERGPRFVLSVAKRKRFISSACVTFRAFDRGFFFRVFWSPRIAVMWQIWKYGPAT